MNYFSIIILTFLFSSCSITNKLNNQIDQNQKASLVNSPFNTAKGMNLELKTQKKYRIQYEKDLRKMLKENTTDTIILKENYNFICFGCPADFVQIFSKNKLIVYRLKDKEKKYQNATLTLTDDLMIDPNKYYYNDIIELKEEIVKGNNWNSNPENYGTDKCFDGGHTFYTVFYPSSKIESMYMRCWIGKELIDEN
ncbi:hypothetical protein [Flammeovirga agarivorans]|uniref:Uncharacterized protein n=1 Tax=Flammeovirga agarivorans TaxID=2726742 RepID=A0A7X8SRW0_9BACT|nr:hypothetical protein [Flammeovirga agarivorans]NLR95124.1 hypothetical protein [Flammeovirga agarivorans]